MSPEERQQRIASGNIAGQWFGGNSEPTIYGNGGLPTARAPQQAAPGSNYVGDGATDPDTNRRGIAAPSRISVSPESMQMFSRAGEAYDPLGTKPMRDASATGTAQLQSYYPRGTYPQATPAPKDMPKALVEQSRGRFGLQESVQSLGTPGGAFMTGRDGGMPDASGGGFVRGNTAYNVNDTSQAGIQRVTARGTSPLYTNIDPNQAVAGLRDQTFGQPADEAKLGLDRFQRANDVRGQMIANRDKDIPAGGYGPGILGSEEPNAALNAERTDRWAAEDAAQRMRTAMSGTGADARARMASMASMANNERTTGVQARGQDLAAQQAGRRDQNMLTAEALRQQGAFGLEGMRGQSAKELEGVRRAGRREELNQQGQDQWALQEARLGAEAPYRQATAGFYGAQTRKMEDDAAAGKSEAAMFQKSVEMYMKNGASVQEARQAAAMDLAAANKAARLKEGKAAGGVVGYESGGQVQSMSRADQILADMEAKYGKAAGSAPAPVQQPARVPPPAQQQPQGMADKFRGYFGSPDARMKQNGLAFGGAVPAQDIPGGRAVAQAVAGRQVFGQSDGSGHDDALPAVIDGERPAALTSGEFVWPVNAVKFYGMDRLNKMLAAAEKGMAAHGDTA